MNKAILIGRLVYDPELKMTPTTNRELCQFKIAVNRPYKDDNGETKADFINCVCWDKLAENLAKYQKKGNQIAVEGRIQTRNYDNESGNKVYVTEILANNITFLETKKDNSNFNNLEEPPMQNKEEKEDDKIDPYQAFGDSIEVNENDLPF